MADIFDQYVHPKTEVKPIIYAYSDTRFPGCLKVGYTDRPIEVRMHEHYPTLTPGQSYKVEYVESALNADGAIFMDHDVHRMLEAHGFHAQKSPDGKKSEWYKCSVDDVKAAILAVKTSSLNLENRTQNFRMRPEQARAVRMTKAYFESETKRNPNHTAKFLWNAKMRFGKTFTSYELAKAMDMKRVLILTFKPAVEESWETDLFSHMDFEGWQFYSREVSQETGIRPQDLDQSKPIVCFGSFKTSSARMPLVASRPRTNGCIRRTGIWSSSMSTTLAHGVRTLSTCLRKRTRTATTIWISISTKKMRPIMLSTRTSCRSRQSTISSCRYAFPGSEHRRVHGGSDLLMDIFR